MKLTYLIFLLIFFISSIANAMTQNQMYIIHQVLNVDQGKVTKQMHTDFWKDVPNKDDVVGFLETSGMMAKITKDGMSYQMELWKSALISYQNQTKSHSYLSS